MTEPPRPTGEDTPGEPSPGPTSPPPPPPAPFTAPGEASAPGQSPPQYDTPGYPPPGGYPPPPPGYPPPGGYPQPGFPPGPSVAPPGYQNSEDKTWVLVAHFGGAAGALIGAGVAGWIAPLIALLVRGNQSPQVRAHAVAALNFQLLWTIVGVVGWIFTCILIGFFGVIAAMLLGVIFGIIAGVKANEGGFYSYPLSVPMIK